MENKLSSDLDLKLYQMVINSMVVQLFMEMVSKSENPKEVLEEFLSRIRENLKDQVASEMAILVDKLPREQADRIFTDGFDAVDRVIDRFRSAMIKD